LFFSILSWLYFALQLFIISILTILNYLNHLSIMTIASIFFLISNISILTIFQCFYILAIMLLLLWVSGALTIASIWISLLSLQNSFHVAIIVNFNNIMSYHWVCQCLASWNEYEIIRKQKRTKNSFMMIISDPKIFQGQIYYKIVWIKKISNALCQI